MQLLAGRPCSAPEELRSTQMPLLAGRTYSAQAGLRSTRVPLHTLPSDPALNLSASIVLITLAQY